MTWRLICDECAQTLGEETKSIGIFQHADVRCANCGVFIRSSLFDKRDAHSKWSPVTEEQLAELHLRELETVDAKLHYAFVLDEDEEKLGAAQDAICKEKTVNCTVYKCEPEATEGAYVFQIYMNGETPDSTYAGTVWRHDRYPSSVDVAVALERWRGPDAPKFTISYFMETSGGRTINFPKDEK